MFHTPRWAESIPLFISVRNGTLAEGELIVLMASAEDGGSTVFGDLHELLLLTKRSTHFGSRAKTLVLLYTVLC